MRLSALRVAVAPAVAMYEVGAGFASIIAPNISTVSHTVHTSNTDQAVVEEATIPGNTILFHELVSWFDTSNCVTPVLLFTSLIYMGQVPLLLLI